MCADRLRADNTKNTTMPNKMSTMVVLIHKVTTCKPLRLRAFFLFLLAILLDVIHLISCKGTEKFEV